MQKGGLRLPRRSNASLERTGGTLSGTDLLLGVPRPPAHLLLLDLLACQAGCNVMPQPVPYRAYLAPFHLSILWRRRATVDSCCGRLRLKGQVIGSHVLVVRPDSILGPGQLHGFFDYGFAGEWNLDRRQVWLGAADALCEFLQLD